MKLSSAVFMLLLGVFISPSVSAGQTAPVFLSLTRKAESLSNMPTNVSIITSTEIIDKKATSVAALLYDELGLTMSRTGTPGATANLMIRGSSPEEVLVLIDGRRINDPAMGLVDFNAIPTDAIERIEIIRGAASAIYGTAAFGGVVNLITRKAGENAPLLNLGASGGSFNAQNYLLNFSVQRER
ncbi:MAG: TonB-dependent receptor, partial [Endomicrobiales bacterium]